MKIWVFFKKICLNILLKNRCEYCQIVKSPTFWSQFTRSESSCRRIFCRPVLLALAHYLTCSRSLVLQSCPIFELIKGTIFIRKKKKKTKEISFENFGLPPGSCTQPFNFRSKRAFLNPKIKTKKKGAEIMLSKTNFQNIYNHSCCEINTRGQFHLV